MRPSAIHNNEYSEKCLVFKSLQGNMLNLKQEATVYRTMLAESLGRSLKKSQLSFSERLEIGEII